MGKNKMYFWDLFETKNILGKSITYNLFQGHYNSEKLT